ncbi:hypothetical protein PMAYCL1PPCAC_22938, partial [Pristionchus mayeri]
VAMSSLSSTSLSLETAKEASSVSENPLDEISLTSGQETSTDGDDTYARETFGLLDADGDGLIGQSDVIEELRQRKGFDVNEEEIGPFAKVVDDEGKGKYDIE